MQVEWEYPVATARGSVLSRPMQVEWDSFASKVRNPTHGNGWMLQIFSTKKSPEEGSESHQWKLVDCSDTFYSSCVNYRNVSNAV
jgi:hypothetical protein